MRFVSPLGIATSFADRFLATSDDDLRTFFSFFDQPREVGLRLM